MNKAPAFAGAALVWAAVLALAAFWGLRLFAVPQEVPAGARVAAVDGALRGDLTRVLGTDPPPPAEAAPEAAPMASRFQLFGVLAPRARAAGGVAVIGVDGQPARAFRVGAAVEGETVLQSVQGRNASLGPRGGAVQVALSLPPAPPAATGVPGGAAAGPVPGARPGFPQRPVPFTGAPMAPPRIAPAPMAPPVVQEADRGTAATE
jgi:general secretion pathway protein C